MHSLSELKDKKILIVTHGGVLRAMEFANHKYGRPAMAHDFWDEYKLPKNAKLLPFNFKPFPHNEDMVIDIHRPYIDEVFWVNDEGEKMERILTILSLFSCAL